MDNENQEKALEVLRKINEVFNDHNIDLWLDKGTLLGAVREGNMIEWDDDIDLSCWFDDLEKVYRCCEILREKGYYVDYRVFENDCFELSHISINFDKKRSFPIDLRLFKMKEDTIIKKNINSPKRENTIQRLLRRFIKYILYMLSKPEHIGDSPPIIPDKVHTMLGKIIHSNSDSLLKPVRKIVCYISKKLYKQGAWELPKKYFEDFSKIDFHGIKVKIPLNPEKICEIRYGEDWRIPDRTWMGKHKKD